MRNYDHGPRHDPNYCDDFAYPEISEPCETPSCQHRCCECGHIECGHANVNVQPNCCECQCDGFTEAS